MSHRKPDTDSTHAFKHVQYVPLADHFSVVIPTQRRGRYWFVGSYPTLREAMRERDAALRKQRTRTKHEQKPDTA